MATIFTSFEVVFSKSEIEQMLIERAKQIVGGADGLALHSIDDVSGQARVKLKLETKDAG